MSRPVDPRLPRSVPAVRRLLLAVAALQLAGAVLTVAQAAVLADVIARIVTGAVTPAALVDPLLRLGALAGARALVAAGQEWVTARASVRARAHLRRSVLGAIVGLGPAWAARQPSGRLVTAGGPGLDALDGYLTRAVPALVAAVVVPPIVLVRIGLADWSSGLVLIACLPLVPLFMALVGVTTRRRTEQQYALLARLAGHFLDLVQGLTTLKVYGVAARQVDTVRRATEQYRRHTLATLRVAFLSGLVLDLIATLSVAVVAVDVGLRLDHGRLDLRTALLVLLLAPELFAPLRAVGAQYHATEEGRVAAAAALDVIAEAAAAGAVPAGGSAPVGALTVADLTVRYPDRAVPALDGLSLTVPTGQVVAVQGRSGGGKTSLLAVLLGLVAPTAGTVGIGAAPVEPAAAGWRAGVAWVPQRPVPTQATAAGEVGLGAPSASVAEVAAALADCHAPDPATPLGEDGAWISAGQRRRLALARALLRARAVRARGGVPLVLLDEPSEDLDAVTEQVVAAVVASLAGWATVLMVTHSDTLAAVAGRRIELGAGRVVADETRVPQAGPPLTGCRSGPPALVAGPATPPRPAGGRDPVLPALARDRGLRRRLGLAAVLAAASGLAGLALTATSLWLICRAAQHPNVQALAVAVVGVRTFALARALLRYAERLAAHDVALRLLATVRARVFAALEPLAPAGLAGLTRGDLLRRFVGDVDAVQDGLVRAVLPLVGAAATAAGVVALGMLLAPWAGLVLAAGLLTGLTAAAGFTRRAAGCGLAVSSAVGERDRRLTALLDGLPELTVYGAADRTVAAVAGADAAVVAGSSRAGRAGALGTALAGLAAAATLPLVLLAAAHAARDGRLDPVSAGSLAAAVLIGFEAIAPLPAAFAAWSRWRGALGRVGALLATPAPVPEPTVAAAVPPGRLGLCGEGLTLAPAPDAAPVLVGAGFGLEPGRRIAVTGPSGSGKSTLLGAALRLQPIRAGRLDVTGAGGHTALARLPVAAVAPVVAGSLQGDHVFAATLRDNLRVVAAAATDADLDQVAARTGLTELISALPEGWSTVAGADGSRLSGGQRQRLLLARALLADPAVLVLDEPTAHLDRDTERSVLADLLAATRGRTVLLTTHRRLPAGAVDAVLAVDGRELRPAAAPADPGPDGTFDPGRTRRRAPVTAAPAHETGGIDRELQGSAP